MQADRISWAGLVRTFQIARGFPPLTVLENLLLYGREQLGERFTTALLQPGRIASLLIAIRWLRPASLVPEPRLNLPVPLVATDIDPAPRVGVSS